MKILIIVDQFDNGNNGTTISTKRFVEKLREHGHIVNVVSTGEEKDGKYVVDEMYIPIATKIARKQGIVFGKPEKKVLYDAIKDSDVVHFLMPFNLEKEGLKIAKKLNVPHTAAFHVQPENITYNVGLSSNEWFADKIYSYFKNSFYDEFGHIHCPSKFIAGELERNCYLGKLHVISNGVDPCFKYIKGKKSPNLKDKFCITMVGRLSSEKRQDLLIEAVKKSKYSDNIQLIFAGNGPKRKEYEKLGSTLKNKPIFGFYSQDKLLDILSQSDLYVHASDVEIEAIACIEAFSTGLVPIISDSKKSATSQFALDERSLFKAGDCVNLSEKIDYWYEHSHERELMEIEYSKFGDKFNLDRCVYKIEEMFKEAIYDNKSKCI